MTDSTLHENYIFIRRELTQVYDLGELKLLCSDLGVPYDHLPHDTVPDLADALLRRMHQMDQRAELLARLRQERGNVNWSDDYTYPAGDDREQAPRPRGDRLPYGRNPLFTGREEELSALAALLLPAKDGQPPAATAVISSGIGGVGKTQLAVEFAHRYGDRFHGVQWLSLADERTAESEVAACGRAMGLWADADEQSLPPAIKAEKTVRAWEADEPRLLIFDNCEEPALLERWRPKRGGARVLVTSRRERWPGEMPLHLRPLKPMAESESVTLLRRHLTEGDGRPPRADLSDTDLRAIVAELGDLPLALGLAGRYLRRYRRVAPARYLTELRRPSVLDHPSLRPEAGHSPTGHERDVWRTFALSYDRLRPDAEDMPGNLAIKGAAMALLTRAAYFAPGELLPEELLLATLTTDPPTLSEDGLERLLELGLLESVAGGGDVLAEHLSYRLHRLIGQFVQKELSRTNAEITKEEGGMEAREAVEEAVISLAYDLNNAEDPQAFYAFEKHLRYVTKATGNREDNNAAELSSNLGCYLTMIGDLPGARPYLERALFIDEKSHSHASPKVATALNNLGLLLQAQGNLAEAQQYFKRALAVCERVLGPDHLDTASSLNNLGSLLQDLGDLVGAREHYERALATWERALGPNHYDTARGLNNLGNLLQAQGDLPAAQSYYERVLAIYLRVLDPYHPRMATSLNNLGTVLQALGDLDRARPYLERALSIRERVLGPEHPDTALSINNLGFQLRAQGDLVGARSCYERALAIRLRVLGPDHPDTAQSLNNMGLLLKDQGDLAGARPYYERALTVHEHILGPNHPSTATSFYNLGALLQAQGSLAGARLYYERALAVRERVLGRDHPATARSLNNLGALCYDEGNLPDAAAYMRRALAIREKVLGPQHPNTINTRDSLVAIETAMREGRRKSSYGSMRKKRKKKR